jgi:uncharacterized membrane protein
MRCQGGNHTDSQIYIIVSIAVLAVVCALVFITGRGERRNRLTPLASLAFAFVLAGIIFNDDRRVGYSLIGVGVILAVADMIRRLMGRAR